MRMRSLLEAAAIALQLRPNGIAGAKSYPRWSKLAFTLIGLAGVGLILYGFVGQTPGATSALLSTATQPANTDTGSTRQMHSYRGSGGEPGAFAAPIPTPTPAIHIVAEGESLLQIAADYGVSAERIAEANDLWDPNRLRVGQKLVIPYPGLPLPPRKPEQPGEIRFWWPLQGEITTRFGEEKSYYIGGGHSGIDIAANWGTPVRAAASGQVVVAWKRPDNVGWHIVIDHGNGWSTLYGHLSRFLVDEGDAVERGEVIGSVGDTGFSFGPHLHFEIRRWGKTLDPLDHLP